MTDRGDYATRHAQKGSEIEDYDEEASGPAQSTNTIDVINVDKVTNKLEEGYSVEDTL